MLYGIARFFLLIYFSLFRRVSIKGRENIPKSGPLLLYANHPSDMDMFFIACFMKRHIHFMAKIELFKNPIQAFFLRAVGAFPVSRGKGDVGSVKTTLKLLEKGKVVGIFPEGTRTAKKDPNKRKAGAAMFAINSKAPILPVGVKWNKKNFSRVELVFGEPFNVSSINEDQRATKEELIEATDVIMDKIYCLIGQ